MSRVDAKQLKKLGLCKESKFNEFAVAPEGSNLEMADVSQSIEEDASASPVADGPEFFIRALQGHNAGLGKVIADVLLDELK